MTRKIDARKEIFDAVDTGVNYPPHSNLWAEALEIAQEKGIPIAGLFELLTERMTASDMQELILFISDQKTRPLFSNRSSSSVARLAAESILFTSPIKIVDTLNSRREDLKNSLAKLRKSLK